MPILWYDLRMGMKKKWTDRSIKDGFNKYFAENDNYPTSDELTLVDYLPSARQIQRIYGGIPQLRTKLGLEIVDYTKGATRSKLSSVINSRGNELELEMEKKLVAIFGKCFVHSERKIFNTGKSRFDFYLFTKQGEIGIDVFYASSFSLLKRIINLKQMKYKGYSVTALYFVCGNKDIDQERINKFVQGKMNQLAGNIKVLAYKDFLMEVKSFKPLKAI